MINCVPKMWIIEVTSEGFKGDVSSFIGPFTTDGEAYQYAADHADNDTDFKVHRLYSSL